MFKIDLYKGLSNRNYLVGFNFHTDISNFLYYADSPLKNYEYTDLFKELKIVVTSGNLESGINIYDYEEPSALYCFFKVIKKPFWIKTAPVPHYPRYRALNPYQRYEYITFLCNPYTKTNIGYVYLLFYCLERRLSEGKEEVIPIMKKLADFHGGKFKVSVYGTLRKYELWKSGSRTPENCRVFCNYTLFVGCYDDSIK